MPDDQLSRVFAALADPTRRDIVARLAVGDATVGSPRTPSPRSGRLQAVLEERRLGQEQAQRRPKHLEAEVFDLMTKWIERYRQQAEERFRRLERHPGRRKPINQPKRGAAS